MNKWNLKIYLKMQYKKRNNKKNKNVLIHK